MKISINQKCIGCGICFNEKKYILEDLTGLAKAIEGIIISPEDEQRMTELCNLCPGQAIIKTYTPVHSNNKILLKDMINELENSLMKLNIPRLNHDNAPFKIEHYHFDFPDSENEIVVDYNTKTSAKMAAKTEFNNLVYCSSARNAQIIKILMDYKVKYAKKYYSLDDTANSFYHMTNKNIEQILQSFIDTVKDLGTFHIPDNWSKITSLPQTNSIAYTHLLNYPKYDLPNDKIWSYILNLGPTSLNDYVDYMDFECFDWGDGGFLGLLAKKDWTYSGFDHAVDEFIKDMTRAFNHYQDDIESAFYYSVNSVIDEYEKALKEELHNKIVSIKQYLEL